VTEHADRIRIAASAEFEGDRSVAFTYRDAYGLQADGFAFRYNNRLFAYRNQCRHQPLTLDYGDNEFFTDDRQYLLCRNHGALYEPLTGKCIAGPCLGAYLKQLEILEEADGVYVVLPGTESMVDLE
jgi:nitrite reductase/ring-hydroxylating ferredoxin subunit